MNRDQYENCVFAVCDLFKTQSADPTIITQNKIVEIWNIATKNRPNVPGYYMTDAMEKWGKRNGYQFMFNTNKHGKRKNVMLIKA